MVPSRRVSSKRNGTRLQRTRSNTPLQRQCQGQRCRLSEFTTAISTSRRCKMGTLGKGISSRERAAALIIVLAFVVLLTGLVVAYFSRATSDRPVAHSSFNQSKADQVAASAMDLIIGGLRQEITGPAPTPTPPYLPASAANMLPLRSGNPPIVGGVDPIPNLIRRSVRSDTLSPPR